MTAPAFKALSIDWESPTRIDEDGRSHFSVRCRIPFEFSCHNETTAKLPEARVEGDPEVRAEGDEVVSDSDSYLVEGISSSTSVDWYGTEMSLNALEGMAEQMRGGIPLVPTHWDSEWDAVMGLSVDARVERVSSVERAADNQEQQFLLRVISKASKSHEKTTELVAALERGVRVGQSIGGWFTEVRFISNSDGDIERVIIEQVTLDHNALTRSPANPDSWLDSLRAAADPVIRSRMEQRAAADEPVVDEPATLSTLTTDEVAGLEARHIISTEQGDGVVVVTYAAEVKDDEEENLDESSVTLATGEPEVRAPEPPAEAAVVAPDADPEPAAVRDIPNTEDNDMTQEEIAQIVASSVESAVRSAVEPLQQEISSLRAASKPDEQTPEQRVAALEAKLAQRDATITRLATQPASRAVHALHIPNVGTTDGFARAKKVLDAEGHTALSSLLSDEGFRARMKAPTSPAEARACRENARGDLSLLLRAAESTGALQQWFRDGAQS